MIKVIEAKYVRDYVIWIKFSDGIEGEVDLRDELFGEVFEPIRHDSQSAPPDFFADVRQLSRRGAGDSAGELDQDVAVRKPIGRARCHRLRRRRRHGALGEEQPERRDTANQEVAEAGGLVQVPRHPDLLLESGDRDGGAANEV